MAATTTHSTDSIVAKLRRDFPQFTFIPHHTSSWSPTHKTIHYRTDDTPQLLHELSHALLRHTAFRRDIDLIAIERDAWQHAVTQLAPQYGIAISSNTVDDALDTYRQWLHDRSSCPACSTTGVQDSSHTYRCLTCLTAWHVNDARMCALRRTIIDK